MWRRDRPGPGTLGETRSCRTVLKIAVLDDYQRVALSSANWDVLDAEIIAFGSHIAETGDLVAELWPFDVIVAMWSPCTTS
jgi:hypothetical protein